MNNSVNPGATTITYRQWDNFGMAQIISNYADDPPLMDALVEEFTSVATRATEETAPPDVRAIAREMTAHAAVTQAFIEAELRGDSGNTTQPIDDFLRELGVR